MKVPPNGDVPFCPSCGFTLEVVEDEQGNPIFVCSECGGEA